MGAPQPTRPNWARLRPGAPGLIKAGVNAPPPWSHDLQVIGVNEKND